MARPRTERVPTVDTCDCALGNAERRARDHARRAGSAGRSARRALREYLKAPDLIRLEYVQNRFLDLEQELRSTTRALKEVERGLNIIIEGHEGE